MSTAPQRALKKAALEKLTEKDWEKILNQWQNTWQPNPKIRQVIISLSQFGYNIIPFSNLDQQNGEKYIREHYLPECCTNYFFSYEQKKPKPSKNAFIAFTELAKKKRYIQAPWQILLIDDEIKNLESASAQEWEILQFYNDSSPNAVVELVQKLKQMNILPEDYSV